MNVLPPDYHTHTSLCRHAGGLPIDHARAAAERGIPEMACTDHIPFPGDVDPSIRMLPEEFPLYLEEVKLAQRDGACRVLLGLEADFVPEWISDGYLPRLFERDEFDIILGSVHTGPFWDLHPDDPLATPEFILNMWRAYFGKIAALAQSGIYDVFAHFDLVKRTACRIPEADMPDIVLPALDQVARADMAIEINTSGLRHAANEMYPALQILHWMKERDIPITFGSDAHAPDQIGQFFPEAVALAKEAGYTHSARFQQRKRRLEPLP